MICGVLGGILNKDLVDVYISGLCFEIARDLRNEQPNSHISDAIIGERVEANVIATLQHECLLMGSTLLAYALEHPELKSWYVENDNRYSDHFLEMMPMCHPYTDDPEMYANIWGNLASQMIGAIVGQIREVGLHLLDDV